MDKGDVTSLWDNVVRPFRYGNDDVTYGVAAAWLDQECDAVEDWGCGTAYAKKFFQRAVYYGVDGSANGNADLVTDLRTRTTRVDGILLRHVLEHNPDWDQVLTQALESFTKRLAVVIYTPFSERTHYMSPWPGSGFPEISFAKADLMDYFGNMVVDEISLVTETMHRVEHIFFLSHPAELDDLYTNARQQEAETRGSA